MALDYLLVAYVAVGSAVALAFVIVGVTQVQPMPVTVGTCILLLAGRIRAPLAILQRARRHCGVRSLENDADRNDPAVRLGAIVQARAMSRDVFLMLANGKSATAGQKEEEGEGKGPAQ